MKFDQLIVLLPCLSLEDFTLQRRADEAEQLLGCWSAMWHPAALASAQAVPGWAPAEQPPSGPAGHLVMLPDCSAALLPHDWLAEAGTAGACVIRGLWQRDEMVAAILERVDGGPGEVDPELAADFLALGFCHLMVELLTRQLRYMSNLDEESFRSAAVAAAEHAVRGDAKAAREGLQSAFDLLRESRDYFYPVEAHLIDLTLVAPTTLGASLRAELASKLPTNLLLSGEVIARMARQEPATLAALADAVQKQTAAMVGGEYDERALPLLPPEAILYHLHRGLETYRAHVGARPNVYGRRRFGLSPVLPGILKRLGFVGAMHSTLDDGRFPAGNQSRIQWEGLDGTVLETLARIPIDISRADAFLRLPERLGDSMDLDHVATVVLAHWPGQSSPWYRDLRRIASYSQVLGTFATVDGYFRDTGQAGQQTSYRADQYRSPYLRQDVARERPDPISRWVRYYGRRATAEAAEALDTLAILAGGKASGERRDAGEASSPGHPFADVEDSPDAEGADGERDQRLRSRLSTTLARLARSLAGRQDAGRQGYLVANPLSFARRVCIETPDLVGPPDVAGPVQAVGESAGKKWVAVDLPPMGFAWLGSGSQPAWPCQPAEEPEGRRKRKRKRKTDPPLAEADLLRNDFFEVRIDPHTGAIRSISDYYSRGARLAQQIALRMPHPGEDDPGDDVHYSIMAADEVTVTSRGPVLGEIVCRGRLLDRQGRRVAGFAQTTRVRRGSRVVELQIELDCDRLPEPNPWHSYYAARFAWADATANLYRSVHLANVPTDAVQVEAPHFVDVRADRIRTTLLSGGLPYHRRFGLRKLDTLLVVHGERARSFRLGIGIDVPHPIHAALDFLAPGTILSGAASPPVPSGWLFHLDARHVIATHWEPLLRGGRAEGLRARLLETDGRRVRVCLRCFRPIGSAQKLRGGETNPDELAVDGDRVAIDMGPHEWAEVEAKFAE